MTKAPATPLSTKILSAKLGGTPPTIGKATRGIHLHKAAPLSAPGSHAALVRRLFGKKDHHADTG
jgi:hypothetical protein